jgi:SAM-dependent methyltransferase
MANTAATAAASPDIIAVKARMKATWMAGDFGEVAKFSEAAAEEFIQRRDIKPDMKVLDVACGSGNLAIPAAKAGASVSGVDIAPNLLDEARTRAKWEKVNVAFDEGDAEELPYGSRSFDLVVSMFGAMFAPRPQRAADEMLRVCRPGGQIAMANWTPGGFIGQLFKLTAKHVPPPAGIAPAVMWGDGTAVRERFGAGAASLRMTPIKMVLKFPFSIAETVAFYQLYYGPTLRAFASLADDNKQKALRHDMEELYAKHNRAQDGTTEVEAEYLEVVATRA